MLLNFGERCQESREEGIREERERWESARASLVNIATQTDPATTTSISVQTDNLVAFISTTATASIQTNSPIIPQSSASISTQTEPMLLSKNFSESSPVPISKSPIPANSDSAPFNWANDSILLSTLPMIPSNQPRDLSSLRSSSKNPFSSLRRRHHYSKRSQFFSSQHYTQFHPTHPPLHQTPPFPLDWHRDPRLFELSCVLRSLGWSHS